VLDRPFEHLGATVDGDEFVLPAGELEIRLRQVAVPDGVAATWHWVRRPGSETAVPDPDASFVRLHAQRDQAGRTAELIVEHSGVRTGDAVLLGLIWDHLLDHCETVAAGRAAPPHPWIAIFDKLAADRAAQAEAARRRQTALEASRWGGNPPAERLRRLPANAIGLARLDRALLEAMADAPPAAQRALAHWATWQAYAVAGLAEVDWIAPALAALERGEPMPPPFDGEQLPWNRLFADPAIRHTTVAMPNGPPNCSQQAMAFTALSAAAHADPLAAAVDTVYFAANAYGSHHRELLAAATTRLDQLIRGR